MQKKVIIDSLPHKLQKNLIKHLYGPAISQVLHGPASTTAMSSRHITVAAKGCILPADHPITAAAAASRRFAAASK